MCLSRKIKQIKYSNGKDETFLSRSIASITKLCILFYIIFPASSIVQKVCSKAVRFHACGKCVREIFILFTIWSDGDVNGVLEIRLAIVVIVLPLGDVVVWKLGDVVVGPLGDVVVGSVPVGRIIVRKIPVGHVVVPVIASAVRKIGEVAVVSSGIPVLTNWALVLES